jgi:heme/copper-type cytochrome/quinol oxidase subunit 4
MSTEDHNKTLVILHVVTAVIFSAGLAGSPWIIAKNFRHTEQVPTAILVFGIVFVMAVLFWSTAIMMHLRKPVGRKLALIAAVASFPIFGTLGIYSWWFMHSEDAKEMYRRAK